METWHLLILPPLLLVTWFYTAATVRMRFPTLRNKAIVLLVAHPDDEAMFFAPTVLGLTQPELGNHLKILCLSNGNADGLGKIREKEIKESAMILGLRSRDDVAVLHDPDFLDSMSLEWSSNAIVALLNQQFVKGSATGRSKNAVSPKNSSARTTIDVLITFDEKGVSRHPNHRSLYHGAVAWVKELARDSKGSQTPVALYTLSSVNVARKYLGLLDVPATVLWSILRSISSTQRREFPYRPVFLNDITSYRSARAAMTKAHRSQMVWFRWGWITIGRYMYINDLRRWRM